MRETSPKRIEDTRNTLCKAVSVCCVEGKPTDHVMSNRKRVEPVEVKCHAHSVSPFLVLLSREVTRNTHHVRRWRSPRGRSSPSQYGHCVGPQLCVCVGGGGGGGGVIGHT